jgi:molybdate transport system substrate-binding protein
MLSRLLVVAMVAVLPVESAQPRPLLVSAATSLTDVLEEIAKAYAASGGGEVRFNFAASNVLARQIANGAPADAFISADEAQMDVAQNAGRVVAGTRIELISNQLVVAAPAGKAALVRARFSEAPAEIRRLAIGDPAAVPAGVYARRYLEAQGLWQKYESRIVPAANVRAALVAVEHGGADAAIVYVTDMAIARTAAVASSIRPRCSLIRPTRRRRSDSWRSRRGRPPRRFSPDTGFTRWPGASGCFDANERVRESRGRSPSVRQWISGRSRPSPSRPRSWPRC